MRPLSFDEPLPAWMADGGQGLLDGQRVGRLAVEVILGKPVEFDKAAIPAVVFTDPELAWTRAAWAEMQPDPRAMAMVVG